MSEGDWDSVTRIGRKANAGGGAAVDRERVVKGSAALNAALRSGTVIGTEKKWGTSNTGSQGEGQRLTKVDRSDDIVKVKTVSSDVAEAIKKSRADKGLKQPELAQKANMKPSRLQEYESGKAQPIQTELAALERILGVKLRGTGIGQPTKMAAKKAEKEQAK